MDRMERLTRILHEHVWLETHSIQAWTAWRANYVAPEQYEDPSETFEVSQGDFLANSGTSIFLEKDIQIPTAWKNHAVGLVFEAGGRGEGLLSLNGIPYHGLDRNRSFVPLPDDVTDSGHVQLKIELFNPAALPCDLLNDQVPTDETAPPTLYLHQSMLVIPNIPVRDLFFDVALYQGVVAQLNDGDPTRVAVEQALYAVMDSVTSEPKWEDEAWGTELRQQFLQAVQSLSAQGQNGTMHMVGQSHIDVAWLWPLKETVRKTSRTFSTACTLLDTYPNFIYAQSQPQLYDYVKRYDPEVYERIKQKVAEGRWEIVGGMWVEPDLNMPSGESLVRQLLLGKRFFKQEFDANPRIEWLPDTFGYCASLPQLLVKSGMEYFMTTKMNWNDTNPFPYDLFYWVGIDGTKVLSFLNHGLGEQTTPKDVAEHWNSFKQKGAHNEQMLLYGHGDGGGGVMREMVEYVDRSADLPGLPRSVHSKAHDFFDGVRDAHPNLPEWVGDLYLELHRGTYTSQARNKRWNRKAEVLYREAELWNAFATLLGPSYPSAALEEGWKLILLNQFHDIIPGSSIHEVYERSEADYGRVFEIGRRTLHDGLETIASRIDTQGPGQPLVAFNSLSWDRDDEIKLLGGQELLDVELVDVEGQMLTSDVYQNLDGQYEVAARMEKLPSIGYQTVFTKSRETAAYRGGSRALPLADGWSTPFYEITWNEIGAITRIWDKTAQREVIAPASVANEFQLFHDRPTFWDAWDLDPRFAAQRTDEVKLQSAEVVLQGNTKDVLRFRWNIGHSTIVQDMVLYHSSRRIDFKTEVDWHETHKLLKVAFPVDIVAGQATFEIPFGSVARSTHSNTSWESAQFEVCGHRWADLSEGGYGVSLLNDCKYGYDVKGNVLRLSLLRSPKWPDPEADQGRQVFTYALFPHAGDHRAAEVVKQGYALNHPTEVMVTEAHAGSLAKSGSFIQMQSKHVILDTVKQAEDTNELVLRLYESSGGREQVQIIPVFPLQRAQMTNLLEESEGDVEVDETGIQTALKPFEVQSLKLLAKK